jgi:hypothetical protein
VIVISSAHGASSAEVIGSGRGQSHMQFRHLPVGTVKNMNFRHNSNICLE